MRSTSFNHLVSMDLKEHIRYPKASKWILYFLDAFTKFKVGDFIRNKKKTETVVYGDP